MPTGKDLLLKLANEVNLLKQRVAALEAAKDPDAWLSEDIAVPDDETDQRVIEARARLAKDAPDQFVDHQADESALTSVETDGAIEVQLPEPTDEDMDVRYEFAKNVLQLNEVWPDTGSCEAYSRGGPMWLYLQEAGRDYILQCPVDWRVAMVTDVARFSEQDAQELGRDILKDANAGDAQGAFDRLYGRGHVSLD